jgi:hypothetical protein
MAGHAVAPVDGITRDVSVAAGRKGFKAELDDLRERMRGLGLGYEEIAGEVARRYRLRPREAYRLAYGWTLEHAAARFNARAAHVGTDPQARASMTGPRLCEYEHWPSSERKPSVYVLVMLAEMYETDVLCLLDLADHENLAPRDRLTLMRGPRAETPRLDPVPNASGELAALAEMPTADEMRAADGNPRGHYPDQSSAIVQGISLSLPYIPGRLVIEVSDPAGNAGQLASGTDYTEAMSGQLALVQNLPHQGRRDGR